MTPRKLFLILTGILILFMWPSSAAPTNNIKVYNKEIEIDAGEHLLISCSYKMNKHFQTDKLDLEWTMIPESGGDSKLVYMVYDNNKEPVHQPNERAHGFLERHKGNCSLVINPTQFEDSGIYQVHLLIKGVRFSSMTDVKVHVKTCIESYGTDYCTCDAVQVGSKPGLDDKTILIIAGSVSGGIILLAFVGCLAGPLIYFHKKRKEGSNGGRRGKSMKIRQASVTSRDEL